jgi:DNA-binding transcriptional MerR regulator/methylmalonyl-CoA mutase cobalamin-binding subunit
MLLSVIQAGPYTAVCSLVTHNLLHLCQILVIDSKNIVRNYCEYCQGLLTKICKRTKLRNVNYTVKAAARATGVSESRLRTWERRYDIPKPGRSPTSRRLYNEDDLRGIRKMAALIGAGLSAADAAEAVRSGEQTLDVGAPQETEHPLVKVLISATDTFDEETFVGALSQGVGELGWAGGLDQLVFPAMRKIGSQWEEAAVPPAKEHFASELARHRLSAALNALGPSSQSRPRVLMACPESERHDLGLLGLALLLRMEGVNIIYLGADVPTADIVAVCDSVKPDAACLSATTAEGLASLARASRTILSQRSVRLFIGGPAVSPSGTTAAGILLPVSLGAAARTIVERLVDARAATKTDETGQLP